MGEPRDPRIGTVLEGRYRVLERIAAGGMGSVYRGERLQLGRSVAIKFLHSWVAGHPDMTERFHREAKAMSRLSHPTCVSVLDFGVDQGVPYLVMDFATGRTLRAVLREEGAIAASKAIAIVRQLLAGLAHAHGHGIVHRDVKPDNVVLGEATGLGVHVLLLDFGVAKLRDLQSGLTVGLAVGTPSYMAPEQTTGEPVDARTDVYAVGAVLFEMLTGRKLFDAEGAVDIIRMQRETLAPRLRDVVPGGTFSPELEAALARALAKPQAERFQSAVDFARALEATAEASGLRVSGGMPAARAEAPPAPEPAPAPTPAPVATRPSRLPWVAALLVLGGAAAAAWTYLRDREKGEPARQFSAKPMASETPTRRQTPAKARVAEPPPKPPEPEPVPARPEPAPEPPKPSDPPPPPRPANVPGLAEARAAAQRGRFKTAVDKLRPLRKQYPRNAEIAYLLANLYLEELWGEEGFEAARDAVRLDPKYRRDPKLIKNAVNALVSDRHAGRAIRFLREEIGQAAIPHLEQGRKSQSLNISRRSDQLLRSLRRPL